jgi:hypothetical protein
MNGVHERKKLCEECGYERNDYPLNFKGILYYSKLNELPFPLTKQRDGRNIHEDQRNTRLPPSGIDLRREVIH